MRLLLKLSRCLDRVTEYIGILAMLMIILAVFISTGNALARKIFSLSSNAMLEIQWYLFSGVFLLGAGYAFLRNAHVRIDFISGRLSARVRNYIDIAGIVLVILPLCAILIDISLPLFLKAFQSGERSADAGGLIRWPVYLLVPLGMALLLMQSGSEIIKRIAFLRGQVPDPLIENNQHEEIDGLVGLEDRHPPARDDKTTARADRETM